MNKVVYEGVAIGSIRESEAGYEGYNPSGVLVLEDSSLPKVYKALCKNACTSGLLKMVRPGIYKPSVNSP
jgi:hypothetical protein